MQQAPLSAVFNFATNVILITLIVSSSQEELITIFFVFAPIRASIASIDL